jgi:DnaJ-class molecular chaperone
MPTAKPCERCSGRGWIELRCTKLDEATVCSGCNGSGISPSGRPCWACQGTGRIEIRTVEQQKCDACGGIGVFPIPEAM